MTSRTRQLARPKSAPARPAIRERSAYSPWGQAARVLYWAGVGWWSSWLWVQAAWLANVSFVGRRASLQMLNALPAILLLRRQNHAEHRDPIELVAAERQLPWPLRGIYLVLVGWWLSWIWANIGWALCATLLGLPLGLLFLSYLPTVTTLLRAE